MHMQNSRLAAYKKCFQNKMPRLTVEMAEKLDKEIRKYWQRQHELAVEERRKLEKTYAILRAQKSKSETSKPN